MRIKNFLFLPKTLRQRGVIFLELALAIPILISIVYFTYDLPKYLYLKDKTRFCAHCMVNILQNTTHRITKTDIGKSAAAAYLTIYPGKSMYSIQAGNQKTLYGNSPVADIYCIKKVNGKNTILWKLVIDGINALGAPLEVYQRSNPTSIVGINLDDIDLEQGKIKILLHCYRYFFADGGRCLIDGRSLFDITPRESFGFWMLNPKEWDRDSNDKGGCFFPVIVVFTPKQGLFDEALPE